jgi:membrane protease YdiL (CAAX protease family)
VLGWLTMTTGRLGPAIVTHVVFNGVAVAALLALS